MCGNHNHTEFEDAEDDGYQLSVTYAACEALVAIFAIFGNALVIIVFWKEKRLRRRTKYYIISLAVADFLVGLVGIPFAILAKFGQPTNNFHLCLFTVSLLVVLCTISIFCLVAVSVDRYWAILMPMSYCRNVTSNTILVMIMVCWGAGACVGFLPLMGWNAGEANFRSCRFTCVMDYNYLVFLYFATIIFPALVLAVFYTHIYTVVRRQVRRVVLLCPGDQISNRSSGCMLRVLGAAQKREVKTTQNLSVIVLFFIICWIPLYTINTIQKFCKDCTIPEGLLDVFIILSHLNSSFNPLLYAYHLRDFRKALKRLFQGIDMSNISPQITMVKNKVINGRQALGRQESASHFGAEFKNILYIDGDEGEPYDRRIIADDANREFLEQTLPLKTSSTNCSSQ